MGVVRWLRIGSAVWAFIAAFFWFRSVSRPPPESTYQGIGDLRSWLYQTGRDNRWAAAAAAAAGLSAGLAGIAMLLDAM